MQIGAGPAPRRELGPPASVRPRPARSSRDAARALRPAVGGRPSAQVPRTPTQERPQPRTAGPEARVSIISAPPGRVAPASRHSFIGIPAAAQTLLPGVPERSARRRQCQPGARELRPRTRKIVFEDELRSRAPLHPEKRPEGRGPSPHSVPDYELKYPALSSQRARSRYAAVFHDQYGEFLELQRQVGATHVKLQQLKTLLTSLPAPQSQKEARLVARVWREFERKRVDPGFLDKQARYCYLKGKLRHLKAQIRKFDDQGENNSDSSVYF
ncbi:occludin/ELL domain-containing protein 1 [Nannospalax galili]|uniref:Occludin/ELL domain containing 1 n=1 Tax=Nannospalax galili TaxID=1026970 RepID=A0A8C6QZ85_NANGA|nr:occludin/ELL domain-containing protein 1 [Nannospalax galili]